MRDEGMKLVNEEIKRRNKIVRQIREYIWKSDR